MYFLEHIHLGNIRRFAADVNIPVSRGATIFLAPNGTGKTSLFEAIELSLTGQVRRVITTPDALIRDEFEEAFAEMRFSGNIACRGTVRKGSVPATTGNHNRLFPNIDQENLSYLLRLTHLLPQRGAEWLVQSNSEDAGSLLDKLPIGRDANRASNNMRKIKRGFTHLIGESEKELQEADNNLLSWTDLLARKDTTLQAVEGELKSLDETMQLLNTVISRLHGVDHALTAELLPLRSKCAEVIKHLEIELGKDRQRLQTLTSLENIPKDYKDLAERTLLAESVSKAEQSSLANANSRQTELQKILETITTKLAGERSTLLKLQQRENTTKDFQQAENELASIESAVQAARILLEQLQNAHLTEQDKQQTELQVRDLSHQIDIIAETLLVESQKIDIDTGLINQWKELLTRIATMSANRDQLAKEQTSLIERGENLNQERIANEKSHLLAVTQHDALLSATDAIKSAVAIIVGNLSPDSTICPVCLAEYEPADLKARMDSALRQIQPGLDEASKAMLTAKQTLDRITEAGRDNNLALSNLERSLLQVNTELNAVHIEVNDLRAKFVGAQSPEDAEKSVQKREEDNKTAIRRNAEEKLLAPQPMDSAQWALLLESLTKTAARIVNTEKKIREFTIDGEKLRLRIQELGKTIVELTQSAGSGTVEDKEKSIRDLELSVQKATGDITANRQEIDQAQQAANRSSRQLIEIKKDRDSLVVRWTSAGLPNVPEAEELKSTKANVSELVRTGETDMTTVQQEEVELAKWVVLEEVLQIDREIDRIRGAVDISEHTALLSAKRAEKQTKLNAIKERSDALDEFADKIKVQLEQIQQYILAINSPWKELLNRVVIDPRFAETTLSAYTWHSKQHAEVKVPLHGTEIAANFVASEAQITDLQFTFLLAMALNNQWTPWKALLLDDPTQHHDLVHASSVFDLLRDYIVDHQFQVLLATHDSVHAKFFIRKLQNDGIPANLIELKATQEGVLANLVTI